MAWGAKILAPKGVLSSNMRSSAERVKLERRKVLHLQVQGAVWSKDSKCGEEGHRTPEGEILSCEEWIVTSLEPD